MHGSQLLLTLINICYYAGDFFVVLAYDTV